MQNNLSSRFFPLPLTSIPAGGAVRIVAFHAQDAFIPPMIAAELNEVVEIQVLKQDRMGITILYEETCWLLDIETAQQILVAPTISSCYCC